MLTVCWCSCEQDPGESRKQAREMMTDPRYAVVTEILRKRWLHGGFYGGREWTVTNSQKSSVYTHGVQNFRRMESAVDRIDYQRSFHHQII
ncbi:hypothetical protein AVEN_126855-1 [Araneus ventricosus]|uniref:Uncharacterized protein n=1 Tax=Araneus ventricosus TaxID=182803 RepID=A0A4Y2T631_ARAVE|nr:hypothetical protein AVEN_126855-1 [Araneus ventricosus]